MILLILLALIPVYFYIAYRLAVRVTYPDLTEEEKKLYLKMNKISFWAGARSIFRVPWESWQEILSPREQEKIDRLTEELNEIDRRRTVARMQKALDQLTSRIKEADPDDEKLQMAIKLQEGLVEELDRWTRNQFEEKWILGPNDEKRQD